MFDIFLKELLLDIIYVNLHVFSYCTMIDKTFDYYRLFHVIMILPPVECEMLAGVLFVLL